MLKERSAVVGGMEESIILFGCEYRGFYKLLTGMVVDGHANVIEPSCPVNLKMQFSYFQLDVFLLSFFKSRCFGYSSISGLTILWN
jgi:hypothetical protein